MIENIANSWKKIIVGNRVSKKDQILIETAKNNPGSIVVLPTIYLANIFKNILPDNQVVSVTNPEEVKDSTKPVIFDSDSVAVLLNLVK